MNLGAKILFCTILFSAAPQLLSQQIDEFERVLLPVILRGEIEGAHGSRWATRVSIFNGADVPVEIRGYDPSAIVLPVPAPDTPPGVTFQPIVSLIPARIEGSFLLVEREYADDVEIELRVQDLSRQSMTWGTELPVVAESEFRSAPIRILDVPFKEGFRQALRIYSLVPTPGAEAIVRIFRTDPARHYPHGQPPDELVYETRAQFMVEDENVPSPYYPGYIGMLDLGSIPALNGLEHGRIEIHPVGEEERIWAFVSVTNNETQHVTTLGPR